MHLINCEMRFDKKPQIKILNTYTICRCTMATWESGHRFGLNHYIGTGSFLDLEQQTILFLTNWRKKKHKYLFTDYTTKPHSSVTTKTHTHTHLSFDFLIVCFPTTIFVAKPPQCCGRKSFIQHIIVCVTTGRIAGQSPGTVCFLQSRRNHIDHIVGSNSNKNKIRNEIKTHKPNDILVCYRYNINMTIIY